MGGMSEESHGGNPDRGNPDRDESWRVNPVDDTAVALLRARALVLHDIVACGADVPDIVNMLDAAVHEREWWVRRWPEGMGFLAGQVAQDVQDLLVDTEGRWPPCPLHRDEALQLEPPMGPDPHWVCGLGCGKVAPLGALPRQT